jgi:hypothetical protein
MHTWDRTRKKTLFVSDGGQDGKIEAFLLASGQIEILTEDEYGNCTSTDLSVDLAEELAGAILAVRQGLS